MKAHQFLLLWVGDTVLLTHQEQPLAVLQVEDIYSYDKEFMAGQVYGTTDLAHPGVCFATGPI